MNIWAHSRLWREPGFSGFREGKLCLPRSIPSASLRERAAPSGLTRPYNPLRGPNRFAVWLRYSRARERNGAGRYKSPPGNKTTFSFPAVCRAFLCLLLLSCKLREGEAPVRLEFPPLPAPWTEILGSPRWSIRYYTEGEREANESFLEDGGELFLPPSAAGPVFAWPYWPARGLEPGDFRPAGLILPCDALPPEGASARRLVLSWQGGLDAWFYQALEEAALERAAMGGGDAGSPERGRNFNWPKFRALFSDPAVPQEIREDPWRVDWEAVAEETIHSGFRKQRLKVMETSALSIPAVPGPWISPSPFAPALEFGSGPCVFPVGPGPGVQAWYSAGGILHCSGESWMFLPWE